jgi:integrase
LFLSAFFCPYLFFGVSVSLWYFVMVSDFHTMTLTNKIIDAAKAAEKAYKLADFDGLYLYVAATGLKSWRYNYQESGKQKTQTYGRYPLLGIADARRAHHEFKYVKKTEATQKSFRDIAENWMRLHLPKLRNTKHQKQIASTLEQFAYPIIGDVPIAEIKRKDIVSVVRSVADRGIVETAHRVAGRIKQVFDFAVDLGEIEHNPAVGLSRILPAVQSKHMAAVTWAEMPELLKKIQGYEEPVTRTGLLMLAHTFVRTRELILARWEEVDFENQVWIIPPERMKRSRVGKPSPPHVVPLSGPVIQLLERLADVTLSSGYLLESPARKGKPLSENGLLFALYSLGYRGRMTGHGFRAVASSRLNESNLWSPNAIERQLAHKESDEVRAAYNRADHFEERVKMMAWWSKELCRLA